jgi:GNAT superfamily N-acetyltransferase
MMVVAIRPKMPADDVALAALFREMQAHYGVPCPDETKILSDLAAPPAGTEILVAEIDGAIVGFAAFSALYPGPGLNSGFFLKELYVAAEARGSGAGRALLAELSRLAVARGHTRIDWTADRTNQRLIAFYAGLGAKPYEDKLFFRLTGDALGALANDG